MIIPRATMQASVTVHMNASPDEVWALVSDVTRIGEFSPETFEAEWLGDAAGPAVGARFRGHVKRNERGPTYWTHCRVTSCEPGTSFGFTVLVGDSSINNWLYSIEADGQGTDVTESFALTPSLRTRVYWAAAGWLRGRRNRNDMRRTLERMRSAVES